MVKRKLGKTSKSQNIMKLIVETCSMGCYNPLTPGGIKSYTYLNKPAAFLLQVCLRMYELLLPPDLKGLKMT